jgi:hypothetical protein
MMAAANPASDLSRNLRRDRLIGSLALPGVMEFGGSIAAFLSRYSQPLRLKKT